MLWWLRNGQWGCVNSNGDGAQPGGVQSVARAVSILEILASSDRELGVTEIGRRLGVHKATASRLAATLAERRLVERNPITEKFRLGVGLVHLAGAAMAGLDLVSESRPILQELAHRTRETVNLAILEGDLVLNIDEVSGARSVVAASWVGRSTPWHCASNGKVLVAFADEAERRRLLGQPLARLTARTITDPGRLRVQLDETRALGHARTVDELEDGLSAIAAPVRQADGAVTAAISVAGPTFRLRASLLPQTTHLTVEAARAVSRRLGFDERRQSIGG